MATVTGYTAARMAAIESQAIVSGAVSGDFLYLTRYNGATFSAGNVRGPQGTAGSVGPAGVSSVTKYVAGNWYTNPGARSTTSIPVGDCYWQQLILGETRSLTGVAVEHTVAGTGNTYVGLFADNGFGQPGNALAYSGAMSQATVGVVQAAISITPGAGVYWVSVCNPSTNPGAVTMRTVMEPVALGGVGSSTLAAVMGSVVPTAYRATGQSATYPTWFSGSGISNWAPLVAFKFA